MNLRGFPRVIRCHGLIPVHVYLSRVSFSGRTCVVIINLSFMPALRDSISVSQFEYIWF